MGCALHKPRQGHVVASQNEGRSWGRIVGGADIIKDNGSNTSPVQCLVVLQLLAGGVAPDDWGFRALTQAGGPLSKDTVSPRSKKALSRAELVAAELHAALLLRRDGATHAARVSLIQGPSWLRATGSLKAVRECLYTTPEAV